MRPSNGLEPIRTLRYVVISEGASSVKPETERFTELCRGLHDLDAIGGILEWDQAVVMPRKGAVQRGRQQAIIARLSHERLKSAELGDALQKLEARTDLDEALLGDLREVRRKRDRAVKVPEDLIARRARVCSLSQVAWEEAREKDDFDSFRPHLDEVVRLTREVAGAIGGSNPYDVLLDEYEPGMTVAELELLFVPVRDRTVALLERIAGAGGNRPDREVLNRSYPLDAQEAFARRLVDDMGYRTDAGRLDRSVHPFTIGTFEDVRITTRYDEKNLATALFASIHEAGHALYEQGLDPLRYRDPAGRPCSMGIHESQSRFWENLVGRSKPFWVHYFPVLKEFFPGSFDDVSLDDFHRAINVCEPSLIRVEADEVSYNLHVILRFELERDLISGRLSVADLPDAWNEKMIAYLGISPPDNRFGVLQDVHWSAGLFGYFPTYTLGNLYAGQFLEQLRADQPEMDERLAEGNLEPILDWLRPRIHRLGRVHLAKDLCRRVTGRPLSVEPSLTYLERKFSEIYRL